MRWNANAGRANGTKEDIRSFNAYLDDLQKKVYEAHRLLTEVDELVTAETIRNKFLGKTERPHSLIQIFENHNEKMETLICKKYSKGTFTCFQTSLKHTRNFLKWKYNLNDINIKAIDHAFITEYDFYSRSKCKCANNSTVKNIRNFGKIIRICMANKWIVSDPFMNYKDTMKPVDRVYLTNDELQELADKKLATDRLMHVRDIFLFCCFTGLAYADVKKLSKCNVVKGVDGKNWIEVKRQKTNTPSKIPLLPAAITILQRYADHPICQSSGRILPVLSNQKMNAYLKEIADLCGIVKPITFHIARHTFATTVTLLNGVPIESVSKMLGHTNIRMTQHYAKILDVKVGEDLALLKQKLTASKIKSHPGKGLSNNG